jgi:hypothetical protein
VVRRRSSGRRDDHAVGGEIYTGAALVDLHVTELAARAWDLAASTGSSTGSTLGWLRVL